PAPLSTIRPGDRLELCGKLFAHGGRGIDWVHTNCGNTPRPAQPDGWLKIVAPDGTPGPNLEGSREYCRLWPCPSVTAWQAHGGSQLKGRPPPGEREAVFEARETRDDPARLLLS